MKTFADTLGHNITVAQAVEIIDGLTFTGPPPTIPRVILLQIRWHWNDGARRLTFREIALNWRMCLSAVQNEHAHILDRLRKELTEGTNEEVHNSSTA